MLWLLWETFLQIIFEIGLELGFESLGEPFRERNRAHPLLAHIGLLLLGGLAGAISSLAWPAPLLRPFPVPGVSLVLSPLLAGGLMEAYGQWRLERGRPRSHMATFWGGALFAFAMALVRFMWVA